MTLPQQMQYIDGTGEAEALHVKTGPLPEIKDGEILIRVMATGVNRPDILQRQGLYPPPPSASPILGLEVSGQVVALGADVKGLEIGERVCALANGGGYAQYCAVPASQCLPWPKGYDAIQAAALPENYFTVWTNLFQYNRLAAGESLLVHGGSSGIGLTAIQLAHEFGHKVFTTVGNKEKQQACVRFGADAAILYKEESFAERIAELTNGRGVDVILDMVGALYFKSNIDCLAPEGRLVQIALMHGANADGFNLSKVMTRRLTITGSTLRPRTAEQKAAIADSLRQRVWPVLDLGRCAPVIYKTFKLAEVALAHRLMESSQHIGKIMLSVA